MRLTDSCWPAMRFATVIVMTAIHATAGGQPADQDIEALSPKQVSMTRRSIANAPLFTTAAMYVVAGVGAGSESLLTLASIKKAIDAGVIVVRSSRAASGYIPEDPAYLGLLGDNLNPQKARILLMLALTVTHDPNRVQKMFHQF